MPGKSHGQRSLAGCNPWGCKESDMTEHARVHTHTHTHTHTTNFKVKLAATSESRICDYQLSGVSTIILYFPKAKEKEMNSVNQLF